MTSQGGSRDVQDGGGGWLTGGVFCKQVVRGTRLKKSWEENPGGRESQSQKNKTDKKKKKRVNFS